MLKLYITNMQGADELRAKRKGRSPQRGSAFGVSLLEYAVRDTWGMDLPEMSPPGKGKPVFVHETDKHFSVSHSKTHVLVALSDVPVGADLESRRDISEKSKRMIMNGQEYRDFDFFELWCLRESVYKLNGAGNLREILRFHKDGDRIVGPDANIWYQVIGGVEGCAGAICMDIPFELPELIWVDIEELCTAAK
jgi:hypothetical protein